MQYVPFRDVAVFSKQTLHINIQLRRIHHLTAIFLGRRLFQRFQGNHTEKASTFSPQNAWIQLINPRSQLPYFLFLFYLPASLRPLSWVPPLAHANIIKLRVMVIYFLNHELLTKSFYSCLRS